MRALTVLICFFISTICYSQSDKLFKEGNTLYNEAKYAEAIEKYETILETNVHSAELYFNLANANYKLNNIAPSIYYYEKALLLSPNDEDIQNNLAFAQNMTIDAIDNVPEVGFSRLINNIVTVTSKDSWAKIAIGGVILFVLLFLMYHFSYGTSRKRIAFISSILSLLIACMAIVISFQRELLDKKDNPAIVFAQESRVKVDPNQSSEEIFRLHEGTKVQVLETYENWKKIQLSDKSTGWIPSKDIKLLKTF